MRHERFAESRENLVHELDHDAGALLNPFLAAFPDLFFPDREAFLGSVDRIAAGGKAVGPVGRGDRDPDTRLADLETADSVDQRQPFDGWPSPANLRRDRFHLSDGQRVLGFVVQILDPPAAGLIARGAQEDKDRTCPRIFDGLAEQAFVNWMIDDREVIAAGDWRNERDFV